MENLSWNVKIEINRMFQNFDQWFFLTWLGVFFYSPNQNVDLSPKTNMLKLYSFHFMQFWTSRSKFLYDDITLLLSRSLWSEIHFLNGLDKKFQKTFRKVFRKFGILSNFLNNFLDKFWRIGYSGRTWSVLS